MIASGSPGIEVLASSLVALVRTGEIRIRVGHWDDPDTRDADIEEAELLLNDLRLYSSEKEIANGLEWVYYVDVNNIVE